jgi:hypothetical protein
MNAKSKPAGKLSLELLSNLIFWLELRVQKVRQREESNTAWSTAYQPAQ